MNKKVIYLTGCCGFIGSHLTREALNRGYYVRGVDKLTYAAQKWLLEEFDRHHNFTFDKIDINDIDFLYDCDAIINTAAETHVDNSIVTSSRFVHSNINGVHHLLELLRNNRNNNRPRLIHISTDEVYGDIVSGAHVETDLLKPSNPYSATKAAADMLILAWGRTYGLNYNIIRPTNNYGIGQYIEKLIPLVCKYMHLGKVVPLHNGGTPYRNWLHVKDTVSAVMTVLEKGGENEIYNVAGGFEQQNLVTVQKILACYYGEEPYNILEKVDLNYSRAGQDLRYALDDSKLRSLGWAPERKFDEELPKIVDWYKDTFIW